MRAGLLAFLLIAVTLSGCASEPTPEADPVDDVEENVIVPVKERVNLAFNTTYKWSQTLVQGAYGFLDPFSVFVDVPLPETEGGAAIDPTDPPRVHLGLFMPDIPGCDFTLVEASVITMQVEGNGSDCKVPVIADVGPYYGELDVPADARQSGRLGEFLISNFVPHGYAVAQVSVFGSGQSNHCFDMFGLAEQLGVHHAVEWLGSQDWSNGNVGLIGRSYDGSTPWMAAAHGSEHLKTIVPISGLSGLSDLVQWNGASEARILLFHNAIYGTYGIDVDPFAPESAPSSRVANQVRHHATCPDYVTGAPWGAASYVTGDHVVHQDNTYWHERSFVERALENYDGSLYMIHGLQDGNVDPHAGWIAQLALQENGNDVKSLWGQWGHHYPDRVSEHGEWGPESSVRYDWAQDLLEWFDHYLMETGPKPALHHEMQQMDGKWRIEESFPPADAAILDLPVAGATDFIVYPQTSERFSVAVLENQTVLGGLSSVTLEVTPLGPGGQIFVQLEGPDGDFGLSYGIMDLRHATGSFAPVVPGQPMTVEIPVQLFDAEVAEGSPLYLTIGGFGGGFLPSAQPYPVQIQSATVNLSTLERGEDAYFVPPIWYE